MKNLFSLSFSSLAAALWLAAPATQAAPITLSGLNYITVQFKLQVQGSFSDNGSVRSYANPTIQRLTTKDLLAALAADKYAQTNYPANFFPGNARLAITQSGSVVVVNGNNELLVDVSDIVQFAVSTNGIINGRVDNSTGLARPNTTEQAVARMTFDDIFIPGGSNLSFVVQGLDTIKTNDTVPNSGNGRYREVSSDQVINAEGEGQTKGQPFVISGSLRGNMNSVLVFSI